MGIGMFMTVLGAILAFAVRDGVPGVDITTVGVILMIAGAANIAYDRRDRVHEREVTRVEDPADPALPTHTVTESVTDRDVR
ncbi:hypothetical protein BH18ACT9_BH18ACT9_21940 [soil metagenome]